MIRVGKKPSQGGLGEQLVVMLTCFALVFAGFISVATADIKAKTDMKHTPPGYFIPEHRIQLDVAVIDPSGVELVRCYFKAAGEADYVFVSMINTGGRNYSGILPAPSPATDEIEYLFLAVNAENEIVKSQGFFISRGEGDEPPAWQEISNDEEIIVSMELDQVPSEVPGFSDNIVMDQVESGLRFGVVVGGLYHLTATKTATTSGAAASASPAGTVTIGGAGMSTAAILGTSAAAALGVAAIASDSGSSSKSSSGGSAPPSAPPANVPVCNESQVAGGDTPDTRDVYMGVYSGTFRFEYDARSQPDQFKVYYRGSLLHDTGCVGAYYFNNVTGPGSGVVNLPYNYDGQNKSIRVEVIPNCHGPDTGTVWYYTVHCPE